MTDEQKIKVIGAIVENWYAMGCEHASGTLYAIGAVLSMGDDE